MRFALPTLALSACLALAACGTTSSISSPGTSVPAVTAAGTTSSTSAARLTVTDAWAKATTGPMSAAFATLKNTSDHDIRIVKADSPVSASTQLHLTLEDATGAMTMHEAKDGFTLKAGESLALAPGGNHVMFMKLTTKLLAGTTVPVRLTLDDGTTVTINAPVREYNGAKERYAPTGTVTMDATPSATH